MDVDRVSRLIEDIEGTLRVVSELVGSSFEDFMRDVRSRYALRYAIVEIVESSTALGLHILREDFGVERVESYSQVFDKLVENGVISSAIGEGMKRLVRLRNLVVHRYWEVDDARMYREAREGEIDIVKRFIEEIKGYVSRARGS